MCRVLMLAFAVIYASICYAGDLDLFPTVAQPRPSPAPNSAQVPRLQTQTKRAPAPAPTYTYRPRRKAPEPVYAPEDGRTLGGHTYIRNGFVTFPFSAPYVNSSLQAALVTLQVPGADQDIKAVGLSPSVNGQFRVYGVGVELGASLQETSGSDAYSAYVLGAGVDYILSTTFRYEAYRTHNFVLTPALFLSLDKGFSFSPLSAANLAITDPDAARGSGLISKTTTDIVRPELLAAYTFTPVFGVTAEAGTGFIYNSAADQPHTEIARLGISGDFNFATAFPDVKVPVGATLFFSDEFPLNYSGTTTPILGAGVYDMVNSNFNFGIEWARLMVSTPSISILISLTAYY